MHTLETARLIIRPFTLDDLEPVHHLLDHDLEWAGPGVSRAQRQGKMAFQIALAHWQATNQVYGDRAIVLKETATLIGICGFRPWICTPAERSGYQPALLSADSFNSLELGVGYALSSQHRKRGYATEAVKALLEYAFTELGLGRVVALTEQGNMDSVHVMQRVGMQVGFNPAVTYPWAIGVIENSPPLQQPT